MTLPELRRHGAEQFCWLAPNESLVVAGEAWCPSSSGGFVYLMSDDELPIFFKRAVGGALASGAAAAASVLAIGATAGSSVGAKAGAAVGTAVVGGAAVLVGTAAAGAHAAADAGMAVGAGAKSVLTTTASDTEASPSQPPKSSACVLL